MILKKFVVYATICSGVFLYAQDYLSDTKQTIIKYKYQKNKEDNYKLKQDWINPIIYKYDYTKDDNYTTKKSSIVISQPIFKSGGIYYAIKYASSLKKQLDQNIFIENKLLSTNIFNLVLQIKQVQISIQKQELLIDNAQLDIKRKKEQVLNGILDTSFLDDAILGLNLKQNSLIDLQLQLQQLKSELSKLTKTSYDMIQLPTLSLIKKDKFIDKNIYIKQAQNDIQTSFWIKNMTLSSYLPTINFDYSYIKYHDTTNPLIADDDMQNIGLDITIPLDIKYSYNIESKKIEYLQKKAQLKDQQVSEEAIYQQSINTVNSIDKKIILAKKDIKLYDSLIMQIQEQVNVGMKTIIDLQTMQNSQAIKKLDIKSLQIQRQLELLKLYARVDNGAI
jgi:outer membrane protein TolC